MIKNKIDGNNITIKFITPGILIFMLVKSLINEINTKCKQINEDFI